MCEPCETEAEKEGEAPAAAAPYEASERAGASGGDHQQMPQGSGARAARDLRSLPEGKTKPESTKAESTKAEKAESKPAAAPQRAFRRFPLKASKPAEESSSDAAAASAPPMLATIGRQGSGDRRGKS